MPRHLLSAAVLTASLVIAAAASPAVITTATASAGARAAEPQSRLIQAGPEHSRLRAIHFQVSGLHGAWIPSRRQACAFIHVPWPCSWPSWQ